MKAILYARASTRDKQRPEDQIEELRAIARARAWEVVGELVERESGAKEDRPLLIEALEQIRLGKAGGLASVELSRVGRSLKHLIQVSQNIEAWGGELVITRQALDTTTPGGRLLFHVLGAVAQFERELTQERVTSAVRRAIKRRGGAWGRTRTVIIPERVILGATALRRQGVGWRAIARKVGGAVHYVTLRDRVLEELAREAATKPTEDAGEEAAPKALDSQV